MTSNFHYHRKLGKCKYIISDTVCPMSTYFSKCVFPNISVENELYCVTSSQSFGPLRCSYVTVYSNFFLKATTQSKNWILCKRKGNCPGPHLPVSTYNAWKISPDGSYCTSSDSLSCVLFYCIPLKRVVFATCRVGFTIHSLMDHVLQFENTG